jgi:hypothetical protein
VVCFLVFLPLWIGRVCIADPMRMTVFSVGMRVMSQPSFSFLHFRLLPIVHCLALLASLTDQCSAKIRRPLLAPLRFKMSVHSLVRWASRRFVRGPGLVRLRLIVTLAQFMVNTVPVLWTDALPQVSRHTSRLSLFDFLAPHLLGETHILPLKLLTRALTSL